MGKKLTKKLLVFLTLMCMIIGIDGKYQSDKRCGKSGGRNASGMA